MINEASIVVSAAAGLASFLSPCILPILPGFISYLSGSAANEAKRLETNDDDDNNHHHASTTKPAVTTNNIDESRATGNTRIATTTANNIKAIKSSSPPSITLGRRTRLNIFLNTVYFVLGFSLIFAVLGVILNSVLVSTVGASGFQHSLTMIGGVVIVGFGAYLILSTKLRNLNFEKKMTKLPRFKTSYITSFVF